MTAEPVDEIAGRPAGFVPHHLPGTNKWLYDVAKEFGIPEAGASRRTRDDLSGVTATVRKFKGQSSADLQVCELKRNSDSTTESEDGRLETQAP